jgi:phosphopantetheine adenylyltransferase
MSVLEQAERIFDKVMVVFPSNIKAPIQVGKTLPFHEVVAFDGLLTDYVNKLKQKTNADFTLIRGIRNGNDLEYEVNLNKAYKDLGSDLNVMYFMTDFPHVSSSMVREIIKVSPRYKLYIPDKYSYAGAIE